RRGDRGYRKIAPLSGGTVTCRTARGSCGGRGNDGAPGRTVRGRSAQGRVGLPGRSALRAVPGAHRGGQLVDAGRGLHAQGVEDLRVAQRGDLDRKSTRLNSSHVKISYAVFCLKKKTSSMLH